MIKTTGGFILPIIMVIIVGAMLLANGFNYNPPKNSKTAIDAQIQSSADDVPLQPLASEISDVNIASGENACTHFDGVCRPVAQLSCCAETRIVCAASKCTGILPPATAYDSTGPLPTINPSCDSNLDQICQSVCADKDGFVCF